MVLFHQISLLLWKNYLIQRRNWIATITELAIPTIVLLSLLLIRGAVSKDHIDRNLLDNDQYHLNLYKNGTGKLIFSMICGCTAQTTFPLEGVRANGGKIVLAPDSEDNIDIFNYLQNSLQPNLQTQIMSLMSSNPGYIDCGWFCSGNGKMRYEQIWNYQFVTTFPSEAAVIDYIEADNYASYDVYPITFAVIFSEANQQTGQYQYTIRVNSTDYPSVNHILDPTSPFNNKIWHKPFTAGVLSLQYLIDMQLVNSTDRFILAPFPEAKRELDLFLSYVRDLVGLLLIFAYLYPFSRLVRHIVEEKEKKLFEGMLMQGVHRLALWSAWIITYFILFTILTGLATIILAPSLFPQSDVGIIFIVIFLWSLNILALACFCATLFDSTKTAGIVSNCLVIALWLPYMGIKSDSNDINTSVCFFPSTAISLILVKLLQFEAAFIGNHYSNIDDDSYGFAVSSGLAWLTFDFFFLITLTWYLDSVLPGEYGPRKPWYFFCSPCLDRCKTRQIRLNNSNNLNNLNTSLLDYHNSGSESSTNDVKYNEDEELVYEVPPAGLISLAQTRNLTKVFRVPNPNSKLCHRAGNMNKIAVNNLSLDFYEGQIFTLLGHNGAGKSTTFNLLSGMLSISSGSANIAGFNLATELNEIRQEIGICPQHNILFDDVTVQEHLILFASIKGITGEILNNAVHKAMEEVELTNKAKSVISSLSGGMKRRLSLAMALIANSRIILLDECTSGVDPYSRRMIWKLLLQKKAGRAIILTTHYMEEADVLADRIGILHQGKLKCIGSSLFLKSHHGLGYTITIGRTCANNYSKNGNQVIQSETKSELTSPQEDVWDPITIDSFITNYIETAERLSTTPSEIIYRLPFNSSPKFPSLLTGLDTIGKNKYNIGHYGLTVTTLEEVFLHVAQQEEKAVKLNSQISEGIALQPITSTNLGAENASIFNNEYSRSNNVESFPALRPLERTKAKEPNEHSTLVHFYALLSKRYHISKRDKKGLCCAFIIPILFLALGLGLLRIPSNFTFPELNIDMNMYDNPNRLLYDDKLPSHFQKGFGEYKSFDLHDLYIPSSQFTQGQSGLAENLLDTISSYPQSRYGAFASNPARVNSYIILVNNTAVHGQAAFSNLASNILLRSKKRDSNSYIKYKIHPFPFTQTQKHEIYSINAIFAAIMISVSCSFIPAAFIVQVVSERESGAKHLQKISGVSMMLYWFSNYLWDFILYMISTTICVLILYAFQNPNYVGENFIVVIIAMILYGICVIPFTYLISFLFSSHSTAQNVMIVIYLLTGVGLTVTSFVLYIIPNTTTLHDTVIRPLFRIFPGYCLADAVLYLSVRQIGVLNQSKWDMDITGWDLVAMVIQSVVYFILTLIIERYHHRLHNIFHKDPALPDNPTLIETADTDVFQEQNRIEQYAHENRYYDKFPDGDVISIQGLYKSYRPSKQAVQNLWFGVPNAQIFGFLGENGGGKTSTLKVLTGDIKPSRGRVILAGIDIAEQPYTLSRLIGYCPQFDALHEQLTARETLYFYARIRGVPSKNIDMMIKYLLDRLTITEYADRPVKTYSGGTKRKLSVAVALIGDPLIVMLDEPSSGMDPLSRRFLWNFLQETRSNRAVLLTTHSMEECEALCDRIAIIKQGQLQCIGTSQHLKSKFGLAFEVQFVTRGLQYQGNLQNIVKFMANNFPYSFKLENFHNSIRYSIPIETVGKSLSEIFQLIEINKEILGITEYSVGQTTLEQIFFRFVGDRPADSKNEQELNELSS